jgi:hypothetical protein
MVSFFSPFEVAAPPLVAKTTRTISHGWVQIPVAPYARRAASVRTIVRTPLLATRVCAAISENKSQPKNIPVIVLLLDLVTCRQDVVGWHSSYPHRFMRKTQTQTLTTFLVPLLLNRQRLVAAGDFP